MERTQTVLPQVAAAANLQYRVTLFNYKTGRREVDAAEPQPIGWGPNEP